jgi:hypothetical protein
LRRFNHAGLCARGAWFQLVQTQHHHLGGDDPVAGVVAEV